MTDSCPVIEREDDISANWLTGGPTNVSRESGLPAGTMFGVDRAGVVSYVVMLADFVVEA